MSHNFSTQKKGANEKNMLSEGSLPKIIVFQVHTYCILIENLLRCAGIRLEEVALIFKLIKCQMLRIVHKYYLL